MELRFDPAALLDEIIYLVDETSVRIVAVSHTSRRPHHWLARLKH
jgi:hypothetical protein